MHDNGKALTVLVGVVLCLTGSGLIFGTTVAGVAALVLGVTYIVAAFVVKGD